MNEHKRQTILSQINPFLDKVFKELSRCEINIENLFIDHICYRTSSIENYEKIKEIFKSLGKLLIESDVNGRSIATYKLNEPIKYHHYFIPLVEIPAPKKGSSRNEGFEHIEVVTDKKFNDLIQKYSHLKLDLKGLQKDYNPELVINFLDCAIKFHHQSLEEVIIYEKKTNKIPL